MAANLYDPADITIVKKLSWKTPVIITITAGELQEHILASARSGGCMGRAMISAASAPFTGSLSGVNNPYGTNGSQRPRYD